MNQRYTKRIWTKNINKAIVNTFYSHMVYTKVGIIMHKEANDIRFEAELECVSTKL